MTDKDWETMKEDVGSLKRAVWGDPLKDEKGIYVLVQEISDMLRVFKGVANAGKVLITVAAIVIGTLLSLKNLLKQ